MIKTVTKIPSARFGDYCYFELRKLSEHGPRIRSVVDIVIKVSRLTKRGTVIIQIWLSPNQYTAPSKRRLCASASINHICQNHVQFMAKHLIKEFVL